MTRGSNGQHTKKARRAQFRRSRGRARVGVGLGLWLGLMLVHSTAASPIRVAVAPFAGERDGLPVAEALTGRLSRRPIERLIAPDAFVAPAEFEPRAADVRRWAFNAAVDAIVVGQLVAEGDDPGMGPYRVDAIVRSGHSGAELARHSVDLAAGAQLGESVEVLAGAILADLGFVEEDVPVTAGGAPSGVSVAPPRSEGGSGGDGKGSGRGLDAGLDLPGFQGDAPIEIKADEAEIIDRDGSRQLVFQKNVWVRQGNVTLRSNRLEADYEKGDSDPVRLVARGAVHVDQGDRQASCDRAVYQRATQRLICQGHAELIQGCDIVRGERIEFDLARDQARVEGAASIVIRPEEDEAAPCETGEGSL